jgi:hypothetical protein
MFMLDHSEYPWRCNSSSSVVIDSSPSLALTSSMAWNADRRFRFRGHVDMMVELVERTFSMSALSAYAGLLPTCCLLRVKPASHMPYVYASAPVKALSSNTLFVVQK